MVQSDTPPALSETWLDVFPDDICDRIAEYVTHGKPSLAALNLASVSRKQTRCLARSLHHPVYFDLEMVNCKGGPFGVEENILRWVNIFDEYPVEVRTTRITPLAERLLRHANVVSFSSRAEPIDRLASFCLSHSLRELHLTIAPHTDIDELVAVLSSLTLEELSFMEGDPLFDDLVLYAAATLRCMETCPTTRFFWSYMNDGRDRSFWDAVALLPERTGIGITSTPPEYMLTKLSQFRGLTVIGLPPWKVGLLGSAVENYCIYNIFPFPSIVLEAHEVFELANCSNMKVLRTTVAETAQDAMVELVSRLPCLKDLSVCWRGEGYSLVKLNPGVMLDIVRAARKLDRLGIRNADVSFLEWEQLLAHVGARLKCLELMELKKQGICEFLVKMTSFIRASCRKLDEFLISLALERETDCMPTDDQIEEVFRALQGLQMAIPTLNKDNGCKHICDKLRQFQQECREYENEEENDIDGEEEFIYVFL